MAQAVHKELKITNDTSCLSEVRSLVTDLINASTLRPEDRNKVVLAIDEAISNVIEHAYEDKDGDIEVVIDLSDECLQVMVRDNGAKFRPDEIHDPDIGEHIRLGRKKGLGMYLMRKIMDEVSYSLDSDVRNELVMRKFIGDGEKKQENAS